MDANELQGILRAEYEPIETLEKIIARGKSRIDVLMGVAQDYEEDREAESLLIAYCRYEYNNAIEDFETNFAMQINSLALRSAIKEAAIDET